MGIEILKILFRFIILFVVQITVLNNIQMSGLVNPYLYVLFILSLPFRMPKSAVMIVAFATGVLIGMFTNNAGLHAAACVMMAFFRPAVLKILAPREGYEFESNPTIKDMGFRWFIIYAAVLIFIHHATLFYFEVFRFSEFYTTLIRAFLSTLFTLILVVIAQYLFYKTKAER